MSAAKKIVDKKVLRELVPLNELSQARFEELSGKIAIEQVRAGKYLFHIDDRDNQVVFLLGGEVSLLDDKRVLAGTIIAGSEESNYPIANVQPRALSARAAKKCVIARVDAGLLDAFLSWDQSNNAEAVFIGADENKDWMTRMLQSQAFEKIPPAKIQLLLLKMDAVQLQTGDTVISQGEDGDYFYTIESGKCAVTRRKTPQAKEKLLAELSSGDCFGEESLVSDVKRNATVTMLTDGVLMRLAKKDFVELLREPLIRYVNYEKAAVMVDEGAVWVDVRSAEDYDSGALEDSVNIPLASLRMEMPELVFNVSYIIYGESGHSCESAAFILSHNGFDVYVLRGGLQAVTENTFCPASDEPLADVLPANSNQGLDEVIGHPEPETAAPVDAEVSARISGLEQQLATLNGEKQQLESDLDSAQKQKASIERVVDEQKRLHELDKQQIARSAAEHEKLRVVLQDEIKDLESRLSKETDGIDKLLAGKQAAVEMLDSKIEEWGRERIFFKSENDEAHLRITEMQKQLEQAREGQASNESGLQKKLDEVTGKLNQKLENKEFQCVELKQSQSRLQGELEAIRINHDKLQQKLDNAIEDSASRQQENDALQAQLAGVSGKANEQGEALQIQLEDMRLQLDEAKQHAADSLERLNNMQNEMVSMRAAETRLEQEKQSAVGALERQEQEWERQRASLISGNEEAQQRIADLQKQLEQAEQGHAQDKLGLQEQLDELAGKTAGEIENKESQCIELEQNLSRLQQELDAIHEDRDSFQQQLGASSEEAASQQQEIEALKARLAEISDSADGQLEAVQIQLEAMRMQREDMHQQADERNTQVEAMQVEMASMKAAEAKQAQEMSVLARQNQELQQLLEQGDEDENARQSENEQLLIKARDDLVQKSNSEQELQGQVDRLRKKLEQTTSELQSAREAERTDVDSIREELHAERNARSAERAEMAARQRELKEQLAVVAAEHEENLANQDRTIEQARMEQMRETRLETESQFEDLQNKLKQAQDEKRGLAKEQQQQYESTLDQLRTEMEKLVQERDAALENQRETHENIKGVDVGSRANVDAQSQAETVSELRSELEEARKNAEVTDRLRTEAEAACVRMKDERDVLQKQVGNSLSLGNPLNVPTLDQQPKQTNSAVFTALSPQASSLTAPTWKIRAAMTGQRLRETSGAVAGKWPRLIRATAFCMVVMAGLVIGLKIFVDKSAVLDTQAQNDAGDFTSTPAAVGEESVSEPAADRQVFAPARPVAQDREEMELPPPPPAPRVTQTLERAETVEAPVPEEQHLVATGSFQDNLKDGGNAPLMMMLPAASFMMGSRGNSLNIDEGPQHEVSMSRFAVSKYEVTFADYDRFARANGVRLPHDETWGRGDSPAINISWKDAQAYVRWLSDQTGHSYHLPTEAQWEFAARAGTSTSYLWDLDSENLHANCFDCGSEWDKSRTAPVGSFPANYFGLHDMSGNVQEWTEDCYRASYEGAPVDGGPVLIPECSQRVVRGGGYTSPVTSLRSASRAQYDQDTRLDNLGFRIVRNF